MRVQSLLPSHCRACGRLARQRRLGSVAATQAGPFHVERFGLVHCRRCDVVYLDPPPTAEDLHTLYQESVQFSDAHYTEPARVADMLRYYAASVRDRGLLPDSPGSRVLEVGAGLAWVSRVCKSIDPSVVTVAQDVSAECADNCEWVDRYHVGPLATLDAAAPFQLASMSHVIEHLVDPAAMLGAIAARLAPGGKLFVTAPYRPSGWTARDGIAAWREYTYLHVPAHVTYLSLKWFKRHARQHGLRVEHWYAGQEDGQAFELVLCRR
ncbi:MAG TPA: class I SAM-dependent methyltransferase [Rhodanobacteraceae bacterium]|nr:class I SAM-dependent methyltransferase [Rhodanobacteraceae bacterium]